MKIPMLSMKFFYITSNSVSCEHACSQLHRACVFEKKKKNKFQLLRKTNPTLFIRELTERRNDRIIRFFLPDLEFFEEYLLISKRRIPKCAEE
jgi:hypothetical protein